MVGETVNDEVTVAEAVGLREGVGETLKVGLRVGVREALGVGLGGQAPPVCSTMLSR